MFEVIKVSIPNSKEGFLKSSRSPRQASQTSTSCWLHARRRWSRTWTRSTGKGGRGTPNKTKIWFIIWGIMPPGNVGAEHQEKFPPCVWQVDWCGMFRNLESWQGKKNSFLWGSQWTCLQLNLWRSPSYRVKTWRGVGVLRETQWTGTQSLWFSLWPWFLLSWTPPSSLPVWRQMHGPQKLKKVVSFSFFGKEDLWIAFLTWRSSKTSKFDFEPSSLRLALKDPKSPVLSLI